MRFKQRYIKQITKTRDDINEDITEREATFKDRTIAWQNSTKGEAYTEDTLNLIAMRDILNGYIEDFNYIDNALK